MARDLPLPPPTACRSCPAQVLWVKGRLGRNIPLEVAPAEHGEWVLLKDPALGLLAVPYDKLVHGGMQRWASHLRRCRLPQGQAPQAPARADPTAGMKFPKRPPDTRPCVKCRESKARGKGPCHRCWRESAAAARAFVAALSPFPPLAEPEARRG